MKQLAIVIPAYKIDYFKDTLDSLVNQSCNDFTVYIGDDASPDDFKSLVDQYYNKLDIVYKRFGENLGGRDLVAHWERCISMTDNEPWLWLFSDDDILGSRCVELFLKQISLKGCRYDIYHFDVNIINSDNNIIRKTYRYPELLSSEDLYKLKGRAKINSFVVENVFSREMYFKVGGFEKFDLAWGSDTATWVKIARKTGIKTILGDCVCWRQSIKNITPNLSDQMVMRKLMANMAYFKWGTDFFKEDKKIKLWNFYFILRRVAYYSKNIDHANLNFVLDNAIDNRIINKFGAFVLRICFHVCRR